jgi:uracil-DNA glycosylase family 4
MLYTDKKRKFEILIENASRCNLCIRMYGRTRVLSEKNGDIDSEILFVGEAPGRLGADRTGIPFFGDQAGRNFEQLIHFAGLTRQEIFITNAVLCNPRDEKGNNVAPNREEIQNCSLYLSMLIEIIKPELIVPLGQCALRALHAIEAHQIQLQRDVRKPVKWSKYTILPMYHPGPRTAIYRSISDQKGDFSLLGEILGRRKIEQKLPLITSFEPSLAQRVLFRIVNKLGTVSKFKLTKLLYLLDWQEVKETSNVLTGFYYIYQREGPLATGISDALQEMKGHELSFQFKGNTPTYSISNDIRSNMDLPMDIASKVDILINKCGNLTDAQIKTRAYLTDPMKGILRRQKSGEKMSNHPVFDGWISPKPE